MFLVTPVIHRPRTSGELAPFQWTYVQDDQTVVFGFQPKLVNKKAPTSVGLKTTSTVDELMISLEIKFCKF